RDRHFLPALRGTPPPFLADSGPIGLGLTLEYRARPLIGCRGIRSTLRDRVPARGGEQRGREQQNRIAARQHWIYITLRVWPGSGKSRARRSLSRHCRTTKDRPRRALSTAPPFPPVLNRATALPSAIRSGPGLGRLSVPSHPHRSRPRYGARP